MIHFAAELATTDSSTFMDKIDRLANSIFVYYYTSNSWRVFEFLKEKILPGGQDKSI